MFLFRTDLNSLLSGMRFNASNSLAHLAPHSNRCCLCSAWDGRQSLGIGAKRFDPEVTSLFSTIKGDGLRSHLTWGGMIDRGSEDTVGSEPSALPWVRFGGL